MAGNGERNVYRVVLFVILIVAGTAVISLVAQGDTGIGEQGIFRLFGGPTGELPDSGATDPAP